MNAVTLPAGVTFDAANKRLVYNGIGAVASVITTRVAAMIWRRLFDEDPPE